MRGLILKRRIKKALTLKEGTMRGWKVATPQADQSDKTRAIHSPQIWFHSIWSRRCKWWRTYVFMMNVLRRQVSSNLDDLVHRTDSPFTTSVTSFPLPSKFCMPQVESYGISKDPLDHLESFKTLMHLQGVANKIIYRAFPTTWKGLARVWFSRLMLNSIGTFKELCA